MKLFQAFLTESEQKIQLIYKNQKDKIQTSWDRNDHVNSLENVVFDYSAETDDVENIIRELDSWSEKYLQWLVNLYIAGQFSIEDKGRLTRDIADFEKYKNRLQTKDINQIKTLEGLERAIEQLEDNGIVSKRQEDKKLGQNFMKTGDAEIFYETQGLKIIIPRTEEAACYFGRGTQWCTAASNNNRFSSYSSQGDLYIFISDMGKFQLWFNDKISNQVQFMDEHDSPLSMQKIKEIVEKFPEVEKLFKRKAELHGFIPLLGIITNEDKYKILSDKLKYVDSFSSSWNDSRDIKYIDEMINQDFFTYLLKLSMHNENELSTIYNILDVIIIKTNFEGYLSQYIKSMEYQIKNTDDPDILISFLFKPKLFVNESARSEHTIIKDFEPVMSLLFTKLHDMVSKNPSITKTYELKLRKGLSAFSDAEYKYRNRHDKKGFTSEMMGKYYMFTDLAATHNKMLGV